jgi:RNA polymerase sigma-70 factor, ECF subfamily
MTRTLAEEPLPEFTEAEAIRQAQNGDTAGFEHLYRLHGRRVHGLCLRMLKNKSDAEDLTQQVFLRLFRKIGTFRGDSCFSTWLHRVTVNAVLMYLRRQRPTEVLVHTTDHTGTDGDDHREIGPGDTSMLGAIERLNLKRAIQKLPAGYKRLLLLHDVMGYMHREIAQLVGCSTGCSKSQVHKARKRLRQLLRGERGQARTNAASAWERATTEIETKR